MEVAGWRRRRFVRARMLLIALEDLGRPGRTGPSGEVTGDIGDGKRTCPGSALLCAVPGSCWGCAALAKAQVRKRTCAERSRPVRVYFLGIWGLREISNKRGRWLRMELGVSMICGPCSSSAVCALV